MMALGLAALCVVRGDASAAQPGPGVPSPAAASKPEPPPQAAAAKPEAPPPSAKPDSPPTRPEPTVQPEPPAKPDASARPEPPPSRPEPATPPEVAPRADGPSQALLPGRDVKLRFSFRFQPWKDVLDWFAQQAGFSLVLDAPPPGTFNYTDDRDYTPQQAIDLLNSVLLTKGYTLVRRERMLMLINLQDGVPPNLVPVIPAEELDQRGEYELVSVLFNIERLSPEEAELEVKKLIGPQGSVVVLASARQLLITDTAGRLRAVRNVLERIDKTDGNTPSQVRTFDLRNAVPQTVLELLRQLLDIPADKSASADGSVRFALDGSNQRLLVSGKPDKVARVEEILKALNVREASSSEASPVSSPTSNSPQLEVYTITSADPDAALTVLQTLMTGLSDVRLALDSKNGNLIALARPEQQATIRATLDQLQREARKVEVITLRRVDPQAAVAAVTKLFGGAEAGKGAPQVDADVTTRQLLVRASSAQIEQIRGLLAKLGEEPREPGTGGAVRMLPLSGPSARAALDRIQEIWPMLHENRIRVVAPSTPFPAVRTGVSETGPHAARPSDDDDRRGPPPDHRMRGRMPPEADVGPAPTLPGPAAAPPAKPPAAPPQPAAAPAQPAAKPLAKEKSAHWSSARIVLASQPAAPPEPKPQTAAATPKPENPPQTAKPETQPREPAPIFVLPGQGGIVITSQDQEALDQFEDLFRSLAGSPSSKGSEFTIFYLKHAKAASVAETIDGIFGGGTITAQDGRSGGGRSGGGTPGGDGGLFGSLMGMSSGGSAPVGLLRITPDSRLNALVVQGPAQDLDRIEQLLRVLDQPESPEDVAIAARPRMIPVYNTQASEVADIVKQIYADRIGSANSSQQRGPRMFEMLAMMRGMGGPMGPGGMMGGPGGMGGQSRRGMFPGGTSRSAADEGPKMTIGVDSRSNNLIVVAPETLFEEVRQLVEEIDQAAAQSTQAVKVVTLERTSVPALQQALGALTGGSVTSTSNATAANGRPAGPADNSMTQRGGYIPPAPQTSTLPTATAAGQGRPGYLGGAGSGMSGGGAAGQQSAAFGRGYGAAATGGQQARAGAQSRQTRAAQAYGNTARGAQAYGGVRSNQAYGAGANAARYGAGNAGMGAGTRAGMGTGGGMSGVGGMRSSGASGMRSGSR